MQRYNIEPALENPAKAAVPVSDTELEETGQARNKKIPAGLRNLEQTFFASRARIDYRCNFCRGE